MRVLAPLLLCAVSAFALAPALAYADAPAPDAPADASPSASKQSSSTVQEVVVTARKLDAARQTIEPALGSSEYALTNQAIQALPEGDNSTLNQVILQMPSVVQDSFGQLHIRDDHANIQFRIDNVILPEGLNVFGQALTPRFAQNVDLVTGALPAQYGLLTAGIVNITTTRGFDIESQVSLYGGSHNWIEPSFELSEVVEAPTTGFPDRRRPLLYGEWPRHPDRRTEAPATRTLRQCTEQYQAFGFFDHIIDPQSRISVMGGISDENFQIPQAVGNHSNAIGFTDGAGNPLTVSGVTDFLSQNLNETQREVTDYGMVTYEHTTDAFTGQLSLFGRIFRRSTSIPTCWAISCSTASPRPRERPTPRSACRPKASIP